MEGILLQGSCCSDCLSLTRALLKHEKKIVEKAKECHAP
jgi:hypothetical protein